MVLSFIMLNTPWEDWWKHYMYDRITHDVYNSTGAMIENTQIANYSTVGMLETSQNK